MKAFLPHFKMGMNFSAFGLMLVVLLCTTAGVANAQLTAAGTVGVPFSYNPLGTYAGNNNASTGLPPGLALDPSTGLISGTPTTAGSYSFNVGQATSSSFSNDLVTITISPTAGAPLVILTPSLPLAASGSNYAFQLTASPGATSYTVTGLPTPFIANSAGGIFCPMDSFNAASPGTYPVTVSASNGAVQGPATTFILTVTAPLTTTVNASGYAGGIFTYLNAVPLAAHYSAAFLTPWLTLDPVTGLFSGIPPTSGSFTVPVVTANTDGTFSGYNLSVNIGAAPPTAAPKITSLLSSINLAETGYQVTATNNPTTFHASLTAPTPPTYPQDLPSGFNFNSTTGVLTEDLPITAPIGTTYNIYITAVNAAGADTQILMVKILDLTTYGVSQVQVVHNFGDGSVANEGTAPSSLFQTADGSFYGTTSAGGNSGAGTAFSLAGTNAGVLASLAGTYGITPVGLVQGTDGNFYGVTASGGAQNEGTIFEITPAGVMTVLHTFGDGSVTNDGTNPAAGLIQGSDGNFYGTTQFGGSANEGTIYVMTPAGAVTILHSFGDGSIANDGAQPMASLVFVPSTNAAFYETANGTWAAPGIFYGTTTYGGGQGSGTIFTMDVHHVFTVLHRFAPGLRGAVGPGGEFPMASLIFSPTGTNGLLYGTTKGGGVGNGNGFGTVFSITPDGATFTTLHQFAGGTSDGYGPTTAVIETPSYSLPGNSGLVKGGIFGVTQFGGLDGKGILYELATNYTVFYNFGSGSTPGNPDTSLYLDAQQNLYGASASGGTNGSGTVFAFSLGPGQIYSPSSGGTFILYTPPGTTPTLMTTLPVGMSIESGSGAPVGTPLATDAPGTYIYSIQNIATNEIKGPYTMTLGAFSIMTTSSLAGGTVNANYSVQLAATNPTDDILTYNATGLPPGLTCSSAGLISGAPTMAGTYSVGVSSANSLGAGAVVTLSLVVAPAPTGTAPTTQSFTDWENAYAITTGSGPTGTPKHDGIPNLLKYVYDIDPTVAMSAADVAALPALGLDTTSHPGTNYLTLTYREYAEITGVTLHVQTSTDLVNWSTVTPDITTQLGTDLGDLGTADPVMEVEVKMNGAAHEFIRLEVTSP